MTRCIYCKKQISKKSISCGNAICKMEQRSRNGIKVYKKIKTMRNLEQDNLDLMADDFFENKLTPEELEDEEELSTTCNNLLE